MELGTTNKKNHTGVYKICTHVTYGCMQADTTKSGRLAPMNCSVSSARKKGGRPSKPDRNKGAHINNRYKNQKRKKSFFFA